MNFSQLDLLLQEAVPTVAPAVVCQVEQAGRPMFSRGYGWINPVHKRQPVTPATLFDLGALTQLFTATVCLRMHDADQLDLDQPVAEVLPDFTGPRYIGPAEDPLTLAPTPPPAPWRQQTTPVNAGDVTFRHLLTHSSGLPAWRNLHAICGDAPPRLTTLNRGELMRRQRMGMAAIHGFNFAYPPGQSHLTSDIGLILLGSALTAVAGYPLLSETIRQWLLIPLKLHAQFNLPAVMVDQIAPTDYCEWRQRRLHGEVHDKNAAGMGGIAGHAGLFATAADLCRLAGIYLRANSLLTPATATAATGLQLEAIAAGLPLTAGAANHVNVLTYPGIIRRGLGWTLVGDAEPVCSPAFGPHSFGLTAGVGTSVWCDPEQELVVTLLTNRIEQGRNQDALTRLRPAVHAAVVEGLRAR
jgi:CubicO group peptidase (beta-lactamase class C family)